MSSKAVIESVAKLAERLIEQNRKLRAELERLGAGRERLRAENQRLTAENALLQRRLAVKELAEGFATGGAAPNGLDRRGTRVARGRVNRLLREVDRCIALVNKE